MTAPIKKTNPTPHSLTRRPGVERKFFLSETTIKRLGGPQAAEIMELLVVERAAPKAIQEKLSLTPGEFDCFVLTHYFQRELKAQLRVRDEGDRAHKYAAINKASKPPSTIATPTNYKITLRPGQSPQEWALTRLNSVTPEAVEKLVYLMHNAKQESVQYNAATKLLGLNGIVEVEKSISIIADAEAVIRELNRRGPYKKKTEIETEATLINEGSPILDDATEKEERGVESSDESEPSSSSPLERALEMVSDAL